MCVCALHFGLPVSCVKAWHRGIGDIHRHFVIQGATSEALRSDTGYPEGDPMSVVAMMLLHMLLHMAMHHMIEHAVPEACTLSFVEPENKASQYRKRHIWNAVRSECQDSFQQGIVV